MLRSTVIQVADESEVVPPRKNIHAVSPSIFYSVSQA